MLGQPPQDLIDDLGRRRGDVDAQGPGWLFEGGELAGEQGGGHEMAAAVGEPLAEELFFTVEPDEAQGRIAVAEELAVALPQGRAGEDQAGAGPAGFGDAGGEDIEPWPAVLVVERGSACHLAAVGGGVEFVALDEAGGKAVCEEQADG